MLDLLIIAFWITWPILCYNLAKRKNRNTGWAVIAGILFGLFAVLYYATVGEKRQ